MVSIKSRFVRVKDAEGLFLFKDTRKHVFQCKSGEEVALHHNDIRVQYESSGSWHRPRVKDAWCTGISIRGVGENMTGQFTQCDFQVRNGPCIALTRNTEIALGSGTPYLRGGHLWRVLHDLRVVNES